MPATDARTRRAGRGFRDAARLALSALCAMQLLGCQPRVAQEQVPGWIVSAKFGAPPGTGVRRSALPAGGIASGVPWIVHVRLDPWTPDSKIDPRLARWVSATTGPDSTEVLIEYSDPVAMPRFWFADVALGSTLFADSVALFHGGAMADSITNLRDNWYHQESTRLRGQYSATLLESFWLTRSVVAGIRRSQIRRLASRWDVEGISFADRGGRAPIDCSALPPLINRDALVVDGRALLDSDPMRDLGYSAGRLSLLDTGVMTDHHLLVGPFTNSDPAKSQLVALDCVSKKTCVGPSEGDVDDTDIGPGGHGTTTCGILVADGSMGECLEGLTRARVECHRVYVHDPDSPDDAPVGMLDPAAYKRACQKLLRDANPVAILEVADEQGPEGTLARSAGRLYRAGVAVVAAAGNGYSANSPHSWIGAPGDHPWVIAVGGRLTPHPDETESNQGRAVVGFRRKPDLQVPTATSSAGIDPHAPHGSHETLQNLAGTSGATPYAGAAALMLRQWLIASDPPPSVSQRIDPGQVYAAMLACGDGERDPTGDQEFPLATGAGLLCFPSGGRGWWGKVLVGSTTAYEIPFTLDGPTEKLRAAIWWPDPKPRTIPIIGSQVVLHVDFDLELVAPDGSLNATSRGVNGVFECVHYGPPDPPASGTWKLRVVGRTAGPRARPVYFAIVAGG